MTSYENIGTLAEEKIQAKEISIDLGYSTKYPELSTRIDNATSVTEVHNLLTSARKAWI